MSKRWEYVGRWAVAVALVSALSACSSDPGPGHCEASSDCPSGALCDLELNRCVEDPSAKPDGGAPVVDAGWDPPEEPDFELTVAPTSAEVQQGENVSVTVRVARSGGFTGAVSVALANPAAGVTAPAVEVGPSQTSATMVVSAGFSANTGPVELTLTGTGGGLTRTVRLPLTVKSGSVAVDITSPAGELHTNGTVSIQVVVTGAQPDRVELLLNGSVLAPLQPPYQYSWDTRNEDQREHLLSVRAVVAGQTFAGPVRKVHVDRTPPSISSRNPAAGAPSLPVTQTFEAVFSEPLRASSVSDQSVLLTSGSTTLGKSLSLSSDGLKLTITPDQAPTPPMTISVTFNGVTDLAGNLLMPGGWSFAFPAWLPIGGPLSATAGATPAKSPRMKLDPMGRPVVAWIESDGTADSVHVSRWTGTAWQSLGTLNGNTAAGTHASNMHLALDAVGNPVVAWAEGSIFVRHWQGNAWANISSTGLPSSNGPLPLEFIVTASGEFLIVIHDWPDTSVHRWQGASWTTLLANDGVNYPMDAYLCAGGSLAVAAGGTILMARTCMFWNSNDVVDRSRVVVWQRLAPSGPWQSVGSPLSADTSLGCYTGLPQLRIDTNQRPIVAWAEQCNSGPHSVRAARFEGINWSLLGGPANWNGGDAQNPRLELLANGLPVLAWDGMIGSDRQVGVSQFDGAAWNRIGAAASASNMLNTPATKPSLSRDGTGRVYIAFEEVVGSGGDIHVWHANQ